VCGDPGESGAIDPAGEVDSYRDVGAETEADGFDQVGADAGDHLGVGAGVDRTLPRLSQHLPKKQGKRYEREEDSHLVGVIDIPILPDLRYPPDPTGHITPRPQLLSSAEF